MQMRRNACLRGGGLDVCCCEPHAPVLASVETGGGRSWDSTGTHPLCCPEGTRQSETISSFVAVLQQPASAVNILHLHA